MERAGNMPPGLTKGKGRRPPGSPLVRPGCQPWPPSSAWSLRLAFSQARSRALQPCPSPCAPARSGLCASAASIAGRSQSAAAVKKKSFLFICLAWHAAPARRTAAARGRRASTTFACSRPASCPGKLCDFSGPCLDLAQIPHHFGAS